MKKELFIAFSALLLLGACVKKQVVADESLLGLEYYPTTAGKFVVYDVDSIIYTELPKDTISYKYRIKEKIADSFIDGKGKTATRYERYIKKYDPAKSYDSMPWTIKEVWNLYQDNKSIQLVESNMRFTKLIFPIQEKATWNGNAFNTLGDWEYSYDYIEKTETLNKTKFDKVLSVKQKYYSTAISYQNYVEKYAKGYGLVYREIVDVLSNTIIRDVAVLDRINSGLIYKQSYVTSGYE